jgi:uncharacterized protein
MMATLLRSAICVALLAALPAPAPAGDEPIELAWEQLIPQGSQSTASSPPAWGVVQHGQLDPAPEAEESGTAVVADYDGKRVRIPGFIVPLEFEGEGVKTFLLVPYVGACIHVPPPPPNQIIYVESKEAIQVRAAFEPISVTGMLAAAAHATELADVGYRITADEVTAFVQDRPRFLFEVQQAPAASPR